MTVHLGWTALAVNVVGIALLFSFGGPANVGRNRAQRIVSQIGLLTLLIGIGLQFAAVLQGP